MPVFFLALIISVTILDRVIDVERSRRSADTTTQTQVLGKNMLVVRNALMVYAQANPAHIGPVELNQLGLPQWFSLPVGIQAYADSGRTFVYYTPHQALPDLATLVGEQASAQMGIARNGQLHSTHGLTQTPLPAIVPDGSIILML